AATATWTTSGDGTFDNASLLGAVYTPGPNDITNTSVTLTLTTDDPDGAGPCAVAADQMVVTINELPSATLSTSSATDICPGDEVILDIATTGVGPFEVDYTDGTDTLTVSGLVVGANAIAINPTADGTYQLVEIRDANSPVCSGTGTGQVDITVNPVTQPSFAPNFENICVDNTIVNATPAGPGEIGTWTIVSGTGTIDDVNSATITVTDIAEGSLVLRWTIDNSVCQASALYTINSTPATPATVEDDKEVCTSSTSISANTPGTGETGLWTNDIPSVPIVFEDPTDPTTTVTGLRVGVNSLTWTITDGSCTSSETLIITNLGGISSFNLTAPSTQICGTTTLTFGGSENGVNYTLRRNGVDVETKAGSNTGDPLTFDVSAAGTYTVFADNGLGCSGIVSNEPLTLTETPVTTATWDGFASTNLNFCESNPSANIPVQINFTGNGGPYTIEYTVNIDGGGAATFQETSNPGEEFIVLANYEIDQNAPSVTELQMISVTEAGECNTSVDAEVYTITITDSITPSVAITTSPICDGEEITFTAVTSFNSSAQNVAGSSFRWFVDGVELVGVATSTITTDTLSAGAEVSVEWSLVGTTFENCATDPIVSNALAPIVYPTPVAITSVTEGQTFCIDAASVALTADQTGGTWTINGNPVADNTNPIFDPAALGAGAYVIRYELTEAGGCQLADEVNVEVFDLPVVDVTSLPATLCSTDAIFTLPGAGEWILEAAVITEIDPIAFAVNEVLDLSYTLTENGCISAPVTFQVTITDAAQAPVVNTTIEASYCNGDILPTVSVSGIAANLTWYTGASTDAANEIAVADPNLVDLNALTSGEGNYIFTIEQTTSCGSATTEISFTISGSAPSAPVVGTIEPVCINDNFGLITAIADPENTVIWYDLNPATNPSADTLFIGATLDAETIPVILNLGIGQSTTLFVAQHNACGISGFTPVIFARSNDAQCEFVCEEFEVFITGTSAASCVGVADGKVTVNISSGGVTTYEYKLRNQADDAFVTFTPSRNGFFTIEDLNVGIDTLVFRQIENPDCPLEIPFGISAVSNLGVTASPTPPSCTGGDGTLVISASGGSGNYTFTLTLPDNTEVTNTTGVFENLADGTYTYVVRDNSSQCQQTPGSINIIGTAGFGVSASDFIDPVCFGESSGSAIITLSGFGVGEYSLDNGLTWTSFTSGNRVNELPPLGTYNILVRVDEAGCEIPVEVIINNGVNPISIDGGITTVTRADCNPNIEVGAIQVGTVSGGTSPYTFAIDGEALTLPADGIIENLSRSVRNLEITDATGCTQFFPINIEVPGSIDATIEEIEVEDICTIDGRGIIANINVDQTNAPGPFTLVLTKPDFPEQAEIVEQFDEDGQVVVLGLDKGVRYRWTVRSNSDEASCSDDGLITLSQGVSPVSFTANAVNVECFGETGALVLSDIEGENGLEYQYEIYTRAAGQRTLLTSGVISALASSTDVTIPSINPNGQGNPFYEVRLIQSNENCSVSTDFVQFTVSGPSASLTAEVTAETVSLPDQATGSVRIELGSVSGAAPYLAEIILADATFDDAEQFLDLPDGPVEFSQTPGSPDYFIVFDSLIAGTYEVIVSDQFGCATVPLEFEIDYDRSVFIPNLITPNGDNLNDRFIIRNRADVGTRLIVTNRWGKVVYENSDYQDQWDGGEEPDGVYFYEVIIDNQKFTGWIELWRARIR
ncbi:gliding motility-associated C-terminal domain-containing protein, partial [Cytophagales bacterium LB-30]